MFALQAAGGLRAVRLEVAADRALLAGAADAAEHHLCLGEHLLGEVEV